MTPLHVALAVLVAFIWGVNFTFIAWALESFPPLMLTALRFFFTAVPLVLFLKPPNSTVRYLFMRSAPLSCNMPLYLPLCIWVHRQD